MLSVWWDSSGVIYWKLLPANTTITAVKYCEQLDRLALKIFELRPGMSRVRFLHDNARPHVARLTREKLLDLGWEVLIHPPYSPDLTPSNYLLFAAMSNAMAGTSFVDEHEISLWLTEFFASKIVDFYSIELFKHFHMCFSIFTIIKFPRVKNNTQRFIASFYLISISRKETNMISQNLKKKKQFKRTYRPCVEEESPEIIQ